ncbi:MAG: cph1 4 [Mucilaginibacter sp.]|nr:cph1 4 [Mucilaginibacter sp.]
MAAETNTAQLLKALEERNAFIETILQSLPIGIAVSKVDDGKTTAVNERFNEIYGWPDQDLADVSGVFHNLYPDKAYRNEIMAKVMGDIQSGDPERMVWNNIAITTHTGEKRIVNAKNIPLYDQNLMIATVTDVTNEYQQAEEIRRARANLGSLINGIHDMIWSVNANLHLITANHSFMEMVKSLTGEIIIEGDSVLLKEFGEEELGKWKRNYERALNGERFNVDNQHYNPLTRAIRYSSVSLSPMINENGDIFGVACYSQDVTQNTLNILELQQRESLITHQNEQLTEIAQINAHEIRRPVASILGLIHLLKQTGEIESTNELLKYLEAAAEELDAIIRRIIDKTAP